MSSQDTENQLGGYEDDHLIKKIDEVLNRGDFLSHEESESFIREILNQESVATVGGSIGLGVNSQSSRAAAPELQRKADMADELAEALDELLESQHHGHDPIIVEALAKYRGGDEMTSNLTKLIADNKWRDMTGVERGMLEESIETLNEMINDNIGVTEND